MGFIILTARRSEAHGEHKRIKAFYPTAVESLFHNSDTIICRTAQFDLPSVSLHKREINL